MPIDGDPGWELFDESSGLLTLPGLVLMQAEGTESTANAIFRLMPESEPPVFELVGLEWQ